MGINKFATQILNIHEVSSLMSSVSNSFACVPFVMGNQSPFHNFMYPPSNFIPDAMAVRGLSPIRRPKEWILIK